MKYYYGNDYREAVSNNPIEIKTAKQLQGYLDNYNVVIPATDILPEDEEIELDSCLADNIEDADWMEEYISNYLSDKYGFLIEDYCWEVVDDKIIVSRIYWNTEEE